MDVTDYKWHHVCVVWDGKTGLLAVFKDGNRNFKLNGFRTPTLKVFNEGNCFLEDLKPFFLVNAGISN